MHNTKLKNILQYNDAGVVALESSVEYAIQVMSSDEISSVIVIDESKKPMGIFTEYDVLKVIAQNIALDISIKEVMTKNVVTISQNKYLHDAYVFLVESGHRHLIVVDEDEKYIGIVSEGDFLRFISLDYLGKMELVEEVMDKTPLIVEASSKIREVAKLMSEQHLDYAIVVQGRKPLGVVDERTITSYISKHVEHNGTPIKELISEKVHFIDKTLYLQEAAKILTEHGVRQLVVLNKEEKIVGLLRRFDVLKAINGSYFEFLVETIEKKSQILEQLITQHKQLEQVDAELQAAEELAHVGSWTWDIIKDQFHGSKESLKIFGLAEDATIDTERLFKATHPDDRKYFLKKIIQAMKSGEYDVTYRIIVDGEVKWIAGSANFFQDDTGKYIQAQGMLQDITVQKMYELELEKLANYDSLTGLTNRIYLLAHLKKLIQRNKRNQNNAAILLLDIDHFRDINDSFGHNVGDELLLQIAKRISNRVRQEDLVCRMSADEFVLVLERLHNKEDVAQVAQEMIEMLSEPFNLSNNIEVHVGVSIGITLIAQDYKDENELLQFADTALFQAKNEGRNCYRFYSDKLTASIQERIRYQNEIFHALQNNEFELYYQPQVRIGSDRIIGMEALIRWNHPQKGLINPDVFIPIAEESSLIAQIGQWTLQEACRQGKIWQDKGYDFHISVNVSMNQLHYHDIVAVVDHALNKSSFKADSLILELTESAMMMQEEKLLTILHTLRSKGIGIAIDDFGTGYSSYSYLKKFPVDILKIDKSFIDDIPYKKDAEAIVKAIIAMSEILEYQILAEGVEYPEQKEFLDANGCHYYQGYLKSKPLPAKEFEKLLFKNM
ncbi:EAL domain-containing protein [Sulfurimonas sp.]